MSLWLLTKKNLKLLIRAKSSALIIIFAPLLIILLLGLSFDTTDNYGLALGIHAPSFSDEINSFAASIEEEYSVVKYESLEECISDVKTNLIHTCVSLPSSLQVQGNTPVQVEFHVDPSKINLALAIQDVLKKRFNLKSQELSEGLTQSILGTLSDAKTRISTQQTNVNTIKEKGGAAASSATTAKESLTNIDVVVTTNTYNTADLTKLQDNVNVSQAKVVKALADLNDANITASIKSDLKSTLDAANTQLGEAAALLPKNGTAGVTGLVTKLQNDITASKTKLIAASDAITASNTNLETVNANIQETLTSLTTLQNALAETVNIIEAQSITEAGTVANPLIATIKPVTQEGTYLNYLFPTLLILVIMFGSLLLGTTLVMTEKNSPAFFRNFFLPVKKATFVVATYCTSLILTVVQIIVILGISLIFIPSAIMTFPSLALILFLAASIFSFLGMILGYALNTEETGILASVSLGSLLLFFSGSILPLEAASATVRGIVQFNPFVIAERLVRGFLLLDVSFTAVWADVLILVGYTVVLFFAILIMESVLHKHLVHRFMKHHHKRHKAKDKETK